MADPVAEVLAEHQRVMHADWGWVCSCGHRPGGTLTRDQFAAIAAHQADALRAKGLVVSEVEWSALVGSARCVVPESDARKYADGGWVVESRGVTPWRAADEEADRG